jgi:site-specific recombinase XerD
MPLLLAAASTPIPDLIALVTDSVRSAHSKRAYRAAIVRFVSWYQEMRPQGFTKATVQRYRSRLEEQDLSPATIRVHLAAIRRLASEMADNGLLDVQSASGILKVRGPVRRGVRVGNWLTLPQVDELLTLPDGHSVKGKRDRALLSLLVGAGLRRAEAAALTFEHITQREGRWVIVDLVGKHERIRTIPIPAWCKVAIDSWAQTVQLDSGRVLRPLNRAGRLSGSKLTVEAMFHIVKSYAARMHVPMAPHDLRRSFAKLAHKGHAALEQIQMSLGHQSITTTEMYIGARQNLADAPCDHLGVRCEAEISIGEISV